MKGSFCTNERWNEHLCFTIQECKCFTTEQGGTEIQYTVSSQKLTPTDFFFTLNCYKTGCGVAERSKNELTEDPTSCHVGIYGV